MKEQDIYAEISSIKNLMERSSKFISLSGLSGVMAGVYAILGAIAGHQLVYGSSWNLHYRSYYVNDSFVLWKLFFVAAAVLFLSLVTGVFLTIRKAKLKQQSFWNPISKRLLTSMLIPLITGGLFIGVLILQGSFGAIASSCLIFYGLALVSGSQYTYNDVKWLGLCEIALGLMAALLPGFGLVFWTAGFGILHIIYGSIMHFKYDR